MLAAHGKYGIVTGDCIEVLRELPDACFDLIITDPAWEFIEQHRSWGTTTRLKKWFPSFPNARLPELYLELYRVLKKNRHCYIFADRESAQLSVPLLQAVGFTWSNNLTWVKTYRDGKVRIGGGYHWRKGTELVMFLEKGDRKLNDLSRSEVLFGMPSDGPAEKPVNILSSLVTNSSQPGELVLDCFAGSGSTGVAAVLDGRRPVLIELLPDRVEPIEARLQAARRVVEELPHVLR